VRQPAFYITQCTTFSGGDPDCDSSLFDISNITISNWSGDTSSSYVASKDCAKASSGCTDITIEDVAITNTDSGDEVVSYKCSDVSNVHGFEC
jgi:galacturan 1,4-alpha-galacturonidase